MQYRGMNIKFMAGTDKVLNTQEMALCWNSPEEDVTKFTMICGNKMPFMTIRTRFFSMINNIVTLVFF